ncbi:MAG: RimK family alpha-L-glutamate ligase [Candidatus Hodarchaeota archaeon]
MSLLASRFPGRIIIHDRYRKAFAHLFCLDDNILTELQLKQLMDCYGIKDAGEVDEILQALKAVHSGGKYDFSEKNKIKRELFKEIGKKFALITGREDKGHSYKRYKEELTRFSISYDEFYLDSFSFTNDGIAGFPAGEGYKAVIISNLEPLESDSAPVFLFKEDLLLEISKKNFTLPTFQEDVPARSKLATLRMFKDSKVRTPKTLVTTSINNGLQFIKEMHASGKDVVVKPLTKGGGWGVSRLARDLSEARILDILGKYKWWYGAGVLYLQEFIENQGHDKRVLILDGLILGVEKRTRKEEDESWIYNISKGAIGEEGSLNDIEKELALAAFNATSQFFCGVDIISDIKGNSYILEVNSSPGFTGFEKYLNFNVASFVLSYLVFFA